MNKILGTLAATLALSTGAAFYMWTVADNEATIAQELAKSRLHTINQKEDELGQIRLLRAADQQTIDNYSRTVRDINNQRHKLLVEIEKVRDAKITEFLAMPIPDSLRPILQKRFDNSRKSPDSKK